MIKLNDLKFAISFLLCFLLMQSWAQNLSPYSLYTSEGKPIRAEKMLKSLPKADVVFFGELHNDPVSHWMELQVLKFLYEENNNLILAMEMFEADDQIVLTEYLNGVIEEKHLTSEAKVWKNYNTDYRPLVEFAKEKQLNVVASNIPRRYANLVYRKGIAALDTLSEASKKWIVPLPIETDLSLPGYREMMSSMGDHPSAQGNNNMVYAQAIKDATMAHFVLRNREHGDIVLHVNGAYHSQNGEGIVWYLKEAEPSIKITTIQVVEQNDVESLEESNKGKADFIICVPSDMTKTY